MDAEDLTLCGIEDIKDSSPIYKLKNLKRLNLMDCGHINLKKNNPFEVVRMEPKK